MISTDDVRALVVRAENTAACRNAEIACVIRGGTTNTTYQSRLKLKVMDSYYH